MGQEIDLKKECEQLGDAIQKVEQALESCKTELNKLPKYSKAMEDKLQKEEEEKFQARQKADMECVERLVEGKRAGVEALLDSFPSMEKQEIAGKLELEDIVSDLSEVYPEQLVAEYSCIDLIEYETDDEAFDGYLRLEQRVARIRGNSLAGAIFDKLTTVLASIADKNRGDTDDGGEDSDNSGGANLKIGIGLAGVLLLLLIFSPFLFMGVLSVLSVVGYAYGLNAKNSLRILYSLRKYLNSAYDTEIFQEDKSQVMAKVNVYLDEVKADYEEEINGRKFIIDSGKVDAIRQKIKELQDGLDTKIKKLTVQHDNLAKQFIEKSERLKNFKEQQKIQLERYKDSILHVLNWKREWRSDILIDVADDNRVVQYLNKQENTVIFGENIDDVQRFSQLYVYQLIMHVHPEFMYQVVLDYKYMGGALTAFSTVPKAALRICYTADDIGARVEVLLQEMQARAHNMLATCPNIEAFNALMAEYESNGESYIMVHVFGLPQFTDNYKFFVKNGIKVGMYFKFYMSLEELRSYKDGLPLEDINEFVEVKDSLRIRNVEFVRKLLATK